MCGVWRSAYAHEPHSPLLFSTRRAGVRPVPAAQAGRLDLLRHAQERLKAWAPLLQRFLKSEDDQVRRRATWCHGGLQQPVRAVPAPRARRRTRDPDPLPVRGVLAAWSDMHAASNARLRAIRSSAADSRGGRPCRGGSRTREGQVQGWGPEAGRLRAGARPAGGAAADAGGVLQRGGHVRGPAGGRPPLHGHLPQGARRPAHAPRPSLRRPAPASAAPRNV